MRPPLPHGRGSDQKRRPPLHGRGSDQAKFRDTPDAPVLADGREDRREDVGVVIAELAEISLLHPLQHGAERSKPIPVSTCLAGRGQTAVVASVELDEDEVPDAP